MTPGLPYASLGETLVTLVEPWKERYGDSVALSTTITALHLVAMLLAGGLAVAMDRAVLRLDPRDDAARARVLDEVAAVHPPVIAGLVVMALTGMAMAAADLETYLASPIYWLKLSAVFALLANGALLVRAERQGGGAWGRVRRHAVLSVLLWVATAVIGTVLTNAA